MFFSQNDQLKQPEFELSRPVSLSSRRPLQNKTNQIKTRNSLKPKDSLREAKKLINLIKKEKYLNVEVKNDYYMKIWMDEQISMYNNAQLVDKELIYKLCNMNVEKFMVLDQDEMIEMRGLSTTRNTSIRKLSG